MKTVNIYGENLHIFQTSGWNSDEISREDVAYDNLKSHKKKQSFIHSLEDKVLEKFTGGWGGGCQFDPLSLFRVNHGLYFRASMYS